MRVEGSSQDSDDRKIVVAASCDERYFPLIKGLYLSLQDNGNLPPDVELAFVDIGCSSESLEWLGERGIRTVALDVDIVGELGDSRFDYQRAQLCRPFLPQLFPNATTLAWIDCDAWVQDAAGLFSIFREADQQPGNIFLSPETHFGYIDKKFSYETRTSELYGFYEPLYGEETALKLSQLPTFNSGLFALSRGHSLWGRWQQELRRIYLDKHGSASPIVMHFGEQIALNYLVRQDPCVTEIDPMYNYVSLWNPPFRDGNDMVRLPFPPYLPLGVIHLAGGWKHFGDLYLQRRLLYRDGAYLTAAERQALSVVRQTKLYR